MSVTFNMIKTRKLPLLEAATESLRSNTAKYGFAHVQKNYKDLYFCFYKGINTGLQASPMLAAYELIKQAEKRGIEITDKLEIDYYPECFLDVPKVKLEDIEYLREPHVRAMYKGVKLRTAKGVRSFVCDIVLEGIAYRSHTHPTPMEAAYAVHCGKVKVKAEVYVPPPDVAGPADLSIIQYMLNDTGYKGVSQNVAGAYSGKYSVFGVLYYTKQYHTPEEAAWALHHAISVAPSVDSIEKRLADQTKGMKSIKLRIAQEYNSIKRELYGD